MINCESHPEDRHCHDACERQHPWGSQTGVTAGSRGRPGEPRAPLSAPPQVLTGRRERLGLRLANHKAEARCFGGSDGQPRAPGARDTKRAEEATSCTASLPWAPAPSRLHEGGWPQRAPSWVSVSEPGGGAGQLCDVAAMPTVRARRWGVLSTPLLPASLPLDTPNTGQPALGPRAVFSWLEKAGPVEAGALHTSLTWGQGSGLTSLPSWCCPRIRPRSLQSLRETKEIPQYPLPSAHGYWDWSRHSDGLKDWSRTLRRWVWNPGILRATLHLEAPGRLLLTSPSSSRSQELGLWPHHCRLSLHLHTAPGRCVSVFSPILTGTLVTGWGLVLIQYAFILASY